MNNLIDVLILNINSRKKFLIIIFSFLIGITIPYIKNIISYEINKRAIELNNKKFIIKLEENCKSQNSRYKKLLDLGFQNFAIEEFNICMKKSIEK